MSIDGCCHVESARIKEFPFEWQGEGRRKYLFNSAQKFWLYCNGTNTVQSVKKGKKILSFQVLQFYTIKLNANCQNKTLFYIYSNPVNGCVYMGSKVIEVNNHMRLSKLEKVMSTIKVAVIGGGAAGLCALRHLTTRPSGFTAVGFEQTNRIGGTWVYTDDVGTDRFGLPIHSSMYKNLRSVDYAISHVRWNLRLMLEMWDKPCYSNSPNYSDR